MSLVKYALALNYAMDTYIRRDMIYIMNEIFGKGKGREGREGITISIEHTDIEEYIRKSYEE